MVKPKKYYGQHFLKSSATAGRIAASLSGNGYESVLEIGPGMGILTRELLKADADLWVAEIDRESVLYLEENFPELQQRLIPGDFLQMDVAQHFTTPMALVGNFPYNISSQIIFKMLENRNLFPELVGMFQKEVAERLVAAPGSKVYGILSVLCAAYYEGAYLFTVEPEEFRPPPKVRSGVIRFQRKAQEPDCEFDKLKIIVKTAFNQRRKTLRNALKSLNLPVEKVPEDWWGKRAEQLDYHSFVKLTQIWQDHESGGNSG